MSDFKTQSDIYRALLAGKRVQHERWEADYFVSMKNGFLFFSTGEKYNPMFEYPDEWQLVPDPMRVAKFVLDYRKYTRDLDIELRHLRTHLDSTLLGRRWSVVCTEIKDGE